MTRFSLMRVTEEYEVLDDFDTLEEAQQAISDESHWQECRYEVVELKEDGPDGGCLAGVVTVSESNGNLAAAIVKAQALLPATIERDSHLCALVTGTSLVPDAERENTLTLPKKKSRRWTCRKCGHPNERRWVKCRNPAVTCDGRRPAPRVAKHARVLRDTSYDDAATFSALVHGETSGYDCCGCCGRPRGERKLDRDHDHRTGKLRGLLCWKCNRELLRGHTIESLEQCLAYLRRAEAVNR